MAATTGQSFSITSYGEIDKWFCFSQKLETWLNFNCFNFFWLPQSLIAIKFHVICKFLPQCIVTLSPWQAIAWSKGRCVARVYCTYMYMIFVTERLYQQEVYYILFCCLRYTLLCLTFMHSTMTKWMRNTGRESKN